jgi:hypothetical protein
LLFAVAIGAAALAPLSGVRVGSAQQTNDRITDEAAQQIQALLAEKQSRTPAQQKIDSQLLYAIKIRRGDSIASAVPNLQTGVDIDDQGKVVVDIIGDVSGTFLEDLQNAGAEIRLSYPRYNTVRAAISVDQVETIAALAQVRFISEKQEGNVWKAPANDPLPTSLATARALAPDFPLRAERVRTRLTEALAKLSQDKRPIVPNVGSQQSQGDTTHKANLARSTFGANGAGLRIGVLSNGVVSLAASQALGDLGPVTVLPGQTGTGDEGTAMLEIVHDLAPGAELFFATANPIIAAFAQNIRDLRSAGCDIIIDDVFYFVETPFQDGQAPSVISTTNGGLVIQAVNDVTAAGAMYFSSAGNQGNQNDNTSSCYQGDFVNGGTIGVVPGGNVHNFGGGAQSDQIQTGSGNPIDLYWSDPLGGSANDYDLFILNPGLAAVVASSTNVQNGTQDPFEQTNAGNTTNNRVVVLQKTGAANRFLHITINANGLGKLSISTEGTTKGHSISALAYGVGATPAAAPGPFPAPHSSTNVTETFSSDGPRRIFFSANGTPFTPGNFSSTGGIVRQKPDITAADRVSVTGVGGFPTTFSGTSAAAPHAGAIAALLKSGFPSLTPAQVRTILTSTAIDIEAAGVDRDSGVGIVMPFEALQSNGAVASANFEAGTITTTELCCNGNTFVEPGESGALTVQLTNTGTANATAISATLSTTTPNVGIFQNTSAYPDLNSPAGSGTNVTPFRFNLGAAAPCDLKIDFIMTVTYTGGNSPKQVKFSVQTGRPPVSVTTTIDGFVPPPSSDYTAATGTQTNRVTRDGRASTANLPKAACPGITAAASPRRDSYTFTTCPGVPTRTVTVSLTTPCPVVGGGTQLFAVAYTPTFVPTAVCNNYLADAGSSPAANGTVSFSFNVAGGSTFVVTVSEVPGTATDCNYTLTVSGVCLACPTAAPARISGRLLAVDGSPLAGATVELSGGREATTVSDSNGNYRFDGVDTDLFYTVTPSLANYRFTPASRSFSLLGNKTDAGFTGSLEAIIVANPIDSTDYFVRQQYVDILGREPEQGGFSYWRDQINVCGGNQDCIRSRRIDVSAAFFAAREFQDSGSYVFRLYKAALGRQLGYSEFSTDRPLVVAGGNFAANRQALADALVQRPEFVQKYASNASAESFVDALLQTIGASGVDLSSERSNLIATYNAGHSISESRAVVIRVAAENAVFTEALYNHAFVLMEYFAYLGRDPDQGGLDYWLNVLNNREPGNYRGMVCAFLTSAEYQRRFGSLVTHSNADCSGR